MNMNSNPMGKWMIKANVKTKWWTIMLIKRIMSIHSLSSNLVFLSRTLPHLRDIPKQFLVLPLILRGIEWPPEGWIIMWGCGIFMEWTKIWTVSELFNPLVETQSEIYALTQREVIWWSWMEANKWHFWTEMVRKICLLSRVTCGWKNKNKPKAIRTQFTMESSTLSMPMNS